MTFAVVYTAEAADDEPKVIFDEIPPFTVLFAHRGLATYVA